LREADTLNHKHIKDFMMLSSSGNPSVPGVRVNLENGAPNKKANGKAKCPIFKAIVAGLRGKVA